MIKSPYLVRPDRKFRLSNIDPDDAGPFKDKQDAADATRRQFEEIGRLQGILYAQAKYGLLVILQGMDTSGKDSTIRQVFSAVNPQSCYVVSFKAPSAEELSHDYLWRIHAHAPRRGMIAIHNRSHYESVLVERVRKLVPDKVWSRRYDHINDFERMLSDENTIILKFFLHISKDEQKQRLQARLDNPEKNWKFDPGDLSERKLWDDYQEAYEDALRKCSTDHAPWYVIPANRKWFRDWVISDIIVRTLKKLDLQYPRPIENIKDIRIT